MKRLLLILCVLLAVVSLEAKGSHRCANCPRNAKGRIIRHPAVVREFQRLTHLETAQLWLTNARKESQ